MIKKLSLSLVFTFASLGLFSQTIVSTSPENKKVVLEEYTGIYCVYCPDGHAIAQAIQDNHPNEVFIVNIHVGGYAAPNGNDPDFRTPFGSAIANEAGVAFYPSGSVNRHIFSGGASAMGRSEWGARVNQILAQNSYVNVGVEASIDVAANEIIVHVEGYYTADSPMGSNFFNVALLQNNTLGPQTGGGSGNNYNHMHRLVHLITGQWGDEITSTTTGSFIDETYTYNIPADYNGVPVVLQDLEVVAFITEDHQELISGSECTPTFSNLPLNNDTNVKEIVEINDQCGLDFGPLVKIQNNGNNNLTSVDFEYSINGGDVASYTWSGDLESFEETLVQLPGVPYTIQGTNTINVSVANDDDNTNNDASSSFGQTDLTSTNYITLLLNTDDYGNETTWTIRDSSGTIVESGGPYNNNTTINESFVLQTGGCHEFRIMDAGGNGSSSVVLYDSNSDPLYSSGGNYGSGEAASFIADGVLATNSNILEFVSIYPNPANEILNIKNAENSDIEIYDLLGRVILSKSNISLNEQINVSRLTTGTYIIKITNNNQVKTEKFIVNK